MSSNGVHSMYGGNICQQAQLTLVQEITLFEAKKVLDRELSWAKLMRSERDEIWKRVNAKLATYDILEVPEMVLSWRMSSSIRNHKYGTYIEWLLWLSLTGYQSGNKPIRRSHHAQPWPVACH
jgi:hypothetical protein